jgi:hypothetical protein
VSVTPQGAGTFAVRYRLVVDRYGNGVPYTLRDAFRFAAPVTVSEAVVTNTTPGSVAVNPAWNGTSEPVVAAAVTMADGARHVYTVDVLASVKPGGPTDAERDCVIGAGESGTGFTNSASLTGTGPVKEDHSCAEIPKTDVPPPVRIRKETVGQPTLNDDASTTVVYRLTVTNPGAEGAAYTLTDRFQLGQGIGVVSAAVRATAPGDVVTDGRWNGTTNPTIVSDQPIAAGAIHTYTITLQATLGAPAPSAQLDCALGAGESATGLRNSAAAVSNGAEQTDEACVDADTVFRPSNDGPAALMQPATSAVLASATPTVTPTLPVTGVDVGRWVRIAIVLLVTGIGATLGTYRRGSAE